MTYPYEIECNSCHHSIDINSSVCSSCGLPIPGTINTRRASLKTEIDELEKRYAQAIDLINKNGLNSEFNILEKEVLINGKAVINMSFDFLWEWLIKQSVEYTSYRRQIIDGKRPKAMFGNDVNRTIVDSVLFGSTNDIIYSALSVDETGLISYGEATVILKVPPIENRTSALETNSFFFVEWATSQGWTWNLPLPTGYMAIWTEKHKLAVAKLANFLTKGILGKEISRLILTSNGDRKSDSFIELYIYGKIAGTIIEKIKLPAILQTTTDLRKKLKLSELAKKFNIEFYS